GQGKRQRRRKEDSEERDLATVEQPRELIAAITIGAYQQKFCLSINADEVSGAGNNPEEAIWRGAQEEAQGIFRAGPLGIIAVVCGGDAVNERAKPPRSIVGFEMNRGRRGEGERTVLLGGTVRSKESRNENREVKQGENAQTYAELGRGFHDFLILGSAASRRASASRVPTTRKEVESRTTPMTT